MCRVTVSRDTEIPSALSIAMLALIMIYDTASGLQSAAWFKQCMCT